MASRSQPNEARVLADYAVTELSTSMKRNEQVRAEQLTADFKRCLGTMSSCRAGWDYQLSPAQRADENRQEREALTRARAIWAENPSMQSDLRAAFDEAKPLASMREIEAA